MKVFGGVFVLSLRFFFLILCCNLGFVIALSQISSFFSYIITKCSSYNEWLDTNNQYRLYGLPVGNRGGGGGGGIGVAIKDDASNNLIHGKVPVGC